MNDFTIRIADTETAFTCSRDDTLLRAALRAGIAISYECNSGGCGSCKVTVPEGEVREIWPDAPGLSPRDRRKGRVLACQCRPASDCVIEVRTGGEQLPRFLPGRQRVVFVERRELTPDMAEFVFRGEGPARFQPGQYAMLTLPGVEGDRAYSMSNLPNEAGEWRFIIKRMPGGQGTRWLFEELEPGTAIGLDAPYGHAYLREDSPRDVVCIAGGSGLSPVMSITRAVLTSPEMSGRRVLLFYGGRGPRDICTPRLIDELGASDGRLSCYNATSDPELSRQQGWEGDCCLIHELVERTLGERMKDYEYYFCGPPKMTECVQRMLMVDRGVPFDQIHFDRFF